MEEIRAGHAVPADLQGQALLTRNYVRSNVVNAIAIVFPSLDFAICVATVVHCANQIIPKIPITLTGKPPSWIIRSGGTPFPPAH